MWIMRIVNKKTMWKKFYVKNVYNSVYIIHMGKNLENKGFLAKSSWKNEDKSKVIHKLPTFCGKLYVN